MSREDDEGAATAESSLRTRGLSTAERNGCLGGVEKCVDILENNPVEGGFLGRNGGGGSKVRVKRRVTHTGL